jgi:taurine--2-oxoglutarate transaminase
MPGVVRFFGPYPYRSSFHSESPEQECERALAHLEELVMFEGAHNVAAIIIEPVVGTNGILVPPDGYLVGMRELCDRHGIMMISDEVMAGFGRCGEWFAIQRWDVTPDLICFAKGVNSGYVPLGGVIMSDAIAATFDERVYPGGLTYSGHPLACASAVASIGVFREEGTLHAARTLGDDVIGPELEAMAERHPSVGEVRGLGAFWAIELVRDRATREMYVPYNAAGRRRQTDERRGGGHQGAGCVGVRPFQPHTHHTAVQYEPRRRAQRFGGDRQGPGSRRRPYRLSGPAVGSHP